MKADDTAGPLWIRLFGPFEARVGGQPLPRLRFRKSQMVLALLVLRHGREYARSGGMEREWLAALLWPESAPPAARHNLRNCLTDLRQALGPEAGRLGSSSSRSLCLDLTGASVDVLTFDAALAREPHDPQGGPGALDEAVCVYRGPLLEGWTEEWVFQERQAREQAYLQALERLAARAMAGGAGGAEGRVPTEGGCWGPDPGAAAEGYLRRAVAADPLRERAQRALMQVLAAGGNYAAAIQVYRDLRQRLYREINAEPDAETQALFQQLRAEARRRAARPVTTGPGPEAAPIDPPPRRVSARAVPRSSGQGVAARHCPPDGFPGNLPHELTSFIGREDQMAEIQQWLSISRLVTLTGAGGCGKSRLAREVGKGLLALPSAVPGSGPGATPAAEYADGVWLIELAPLVDPALVPQSVAAPLGVREAGGAGGAGYPPKVGEGPGPGGQPLTQTLIESLKSRHLLLLLDNCEHLIEACARLAETLLQSCPALRILATSREPLGVSGERTYRVPSLSLPPVVDGRWLMVDGPAMAGSPSPSTINYPPSTINQYEAIRLFCERAAGMVPAFALTAENAAAVAQVCRRLDGIPLAIELAAARLKALPVDAIATRLDDMFRLLTGGSRTALPHHQTLRALIDWSFELLTPAEQVLLRRLSVFAGGCSLEAVEAVCSDFGFWILDFGLTAESKAPDSRTPLSDPIQNPNAQGAPEIQNEKVLDLLTRLVEKSLVVYAERDGVGRYRLLEMIREYAREQLAGASTLPSGAGARSAGPVPGRRSGGPGEADALRERHARFFLALAQTAERELTGGDPVVWLDGLEREHDNLRAALAWSVETVDGGQWSVVSADKDAGKGEPVVDVAGLTTDHWPLTTAVELGLQLGCALEEFWRLRGYLKEGMDQLLRLLAQPGAGAPTVKRVRALSSAGRLALLQHSRALRGRLKSGAGG